MKPRDKQINVATDSDTYERLCQVVEADRKRTGYRLNVIDLVRRFIDEGLARTEHVKR